MHKSHACRACARTTGRSGERAHDLLDDLPCLRTRRGEYRAIDDARVVAAAVEKRADSARLGGDQHAGGMVPGQRARMEREMRPAERHIHVFEPAAAAIADAADPAACLERL